MSRFLRTLGTLVLLVAVWSWPVQADPTPTREQARQFVKEVSVRIEIEAPDLSELCTGWIGWTEPGRSAIYTAAHCYQVGAQYRVTLASGETVYASNSPVRWTGVDLMVLWIPRGPLRAIRAWKPIPERAFHALYVLSGEGGTLEVTETPVARLYREIVFVNSPAAVAMPIYVRPGTSGAPVLDEADNLLLGMVVGHISDRQDITAIIPAIRIHKALVDAARER